MYQYGYVHYICVCVSSRHVASTITRWQATHPAAWLALAAARFISVAATWPAAAVLVEASDVNRLAWVYSSNRFGRRHQSNCPTKARHQNILKPHGPMDSVAALFLNLWKSGLLDASIDSSWQILPSSDVWTSHLWRHLRDACSKLYPAPCHQWYQCHHWSDTCSRLIDLIAWWSEQDQEALPCDKKVQTTECWTQGHDGKNDFPVMRSCQGTSIDSLAKSLGKKMKSNCFW